MKKALLGLAFLLFTSSVFAGTIIDRHNFYQRYDPSENIFVYSQATPDSAQANIYVTGDAVAVNNYIKKTIQISPISVGEYVQIVVEGRSLDSVDLPNWATLYNVEFGSSSSDFAKQRIIDVTETVDFLRVGIKTQGTLGTSKINVNGIFTNVQQ